MSESKIHKIIFSIIVTVLIIVFDQISKLWILKNFSIGESIVVIPGVVNFTYVQNTGAAFSLLSGQTTFLILFTSIIMAICVFVIAKDYFQSKLVNSALLLCLGGGIGNIIDRIRFNHVVDFIECKLFQFPIFNVADISITMGAGLIIIYIIKELFVNAKSNNA